MILIALLCRFRAMKHLAIELQPGFVTVLAVYGWAFRKQPGE